MADIFISYAKNDRPLIIALARDLEARGYTVWWDTSLLAGQVFPVEIRDQLHAARAVIVVWSAHSVGSQWVYAEAQEAWRLGKLRPLRVEELAAHLIPLPFSVNQTDLLHDRVKLFAALPPVEVAANHDGAAELAFWEHIKASSDPEDFRDFLREFPQGRFARLAQRTLEKLERAGRVGSGLLPGSGEGFRDIDIGPEMVVIPAGEFWMGSLDSEPERSGDEGPRHKVIIPRPFAAGRYAVTFAEWDAAVADGGCGGYKPEDRGWGRGDRPVINVHWDDAQAYVKWLSEKTGKQYRLLSEAEWEYVARAGTETPFWWGSSITPEQANFDGNYVYAGGATGEYRQKTVPVKSFQANPWGLYQVHGNVWEWTQDCWNASYKGAPNDGSAWMSGDCSLHVLRGGSWYVNPWWLRSAYRNLGGRLRFGSAGFRVARTF